MSQVDRVPEVRAYRQVPERAESTTAQIESPIIAAGLGLDRPGAQVDGLEARVVLLARLAQPGEDLAL